MLDFGFYNMDCMDGMKQFPDAYFDLAIVDPPYGINMGHTCGVGGWGYDRAFNGYKGVQRRKDQLRKAKFYHAFDDSSAPKAEYFQELKRVSKNQIIWGGNFFLDNLGKASCIIVWDKGRRGMDQADCEIAWTSLPGQSRVFNFKWNGMLQENMKEKEHRIHPTQKPVKLYEWILKKYAKEQDKILDTHVGSASSLIACQRLNHQYVGFEIDEDYYRMANHRLETEGAQMTIWNMGYNPYQE